MTRTAYAYRNVHGDVYIDFSKRAPGETTERKYREDFTSYVVKARRPQSQAYVCVCYPQFRRLFPTVTLALGTADRLPELKVVEVTLTEVTS